MAGSLRILCLHGYIGSGAVLRQQISSLASSMPLVDFVFVDALSLSTGDYGWWHAVSSAELSSRGNPGVTPSSVHYSGWEKTRAYLIRVFAEMGPFDGVFGLSQGAALTGLLVGLRAPDGKPTARTPLAFDFAIMVGGFPSQDVVLARLYEGRASYNMPNLHIIGRSDTIVPSWRSYELASKFNRPVILEHGGGHVIATTPEVRQGVWAFLEARRKGRTSCHK